MIFKNKKKDDQTNVVASWTKVPVEKLTEKESDKLLKLEETLHKRVVGQDDAVGAISRAVRRARVDLEILIDLLEVLYS